MLVALDFYFFVFLSMSYLPFALLGVIGSGIGIGLIGMGAMQAIGRNPSVSGDINAKMLTAIALCEVPGLLAFAALFLTK
jgi:F0F1-type ATP synthase membrane subunit c/vacuolar-type H+-ATPase subunit K